MCFSESFEVESFSGTDNDYFVLEVYSVNNGINKKQLIAKKLVEYKFETVRIYLF